MENISININKKPSLTEVWYEGSVEYQGEFYRFWLIEPQDSDYETEVRWFNLSTPKEVRGMYNTIVDTFKQVRDDRRKDENRSNVQSY